jgi:hypothetical protein
VRFVVRIHFIASHVDPGADQNTYAAAVGRLSVSGLEALSHISRVLA